MSMVSREESWVLSSEDSSYPDEPELELGLGLSIGGGGSGSILKDRQGSRAQHARILTAEDFSSVISSSSSSSSLASAGVSVGTKRSADSGGGQVVGWPPVRACRMNSLFNQAKSRAVDKTKNLVDKTVNEGGDKNDRNTQEKGRPRRSSFVKVNMDGSAIGRKVDLSAQDCYETLAETLEDMFLRPALSSDSKRHPKLLDGSSAFSLTYEDKDGDWMLVGDVPWRMFMDSVKRLRIMRTSEAKGLAPRTQDQNMVQGSLSQVLHETNQNPAF